MRRTLLVARVLITRRLPFPAVDRLTAAGHSLDVWPGELPPLPETLRELARDAEGLLCLLTDKVDEALLDAAPRLRAVAVMAVGTDNVDLEACRRRCIPVGNTPGVLTEATADLAFALLLAAARRLPEAAAAIPAGAWRTWEPAAHLGADVHGATLGIVGHGRIGQAVERRARGFDMRIVTTRDTDLPALLATADFVTLHVPLTERTRHLIDADALERMKPTAILVNTSRGGVVDQGALADALRRGAIAGAALDVTDPEPLPADDPLLAAPNLLVVPHIGSATRFTRARMADLAVDNLLAALDGEPMPHPVA
jgi:lactate dehydrogenase-like 2-hydroxyacid dehydrogenase